MDLALIVNEDLLWSSPDTEIEVLRGILVLRRFSKDARPDAGMLIWPFDSRRFVGSVKTKASLPVQQRTKVTVIGDLGTADYADCRVLPALFRLLPLR